MTRSVPVRAAATAAVAGVLVATVSACGAASAGEDTHPDHRSFALHGRTLTIDSDDSALEVVATDSVKAGTIEVTRWFRGSVAIGHDPTLRWSFQDDRLVLRVHCSGFVAHCSARHRIEVPRGISVKVGNGDGGVRAHGFRDPLTVDTADGSVRVTDSSGPLDLTSTDGSVRADVSSRRVRARSTDGSVQVLLSGVPDLVDASSTDGSVTVAVPQGAYRVSAGSDDGAVSVSVPRDDRSPHRVSAHSTDGKVTVRTGK
jgi:hypothetical protein